jgi:hypothetical protein
MNLPGGIRALVCHARCLGADLANLTATVRPEIGPGGSARGPRLEPLATPPS